MATRLTLNHWQDWFIPGSPDDAQLLHADPADRILICPTDLGRGYIQDIRLRDDLSLSIHDYTLAEHLIIDAMGENNCLEFEFRLAGPKAGYSLFVPYFGLRDFSGKPAKERFFKIEVIFRQPTFIDYFQAYVDRLSPQSQSIAERIIQAMYQYQSGGSIAPPPRMLNQILQGAIAPHSRISFEQILSNTLYSETVIFNYVNRIPLTSAMEQIIGQILSCPYQGAIRRQYLASQALELVSLRLEAMVQPRLTDAELECVHQAASILRTQLVNPPTVEALARQVCTNRLKLTQGFRQVYGTTPYGYLRDCRLTQAKRLLMTSDFSTESVASTVGYASRNHFAKTFRREIGINPKVFQMQAWKFAS